MAGKKKAEKDEIDKLLDGLNLKGLSQEEVVGQNGLLKQLTTKLLNRILEAEMEEHLGYSKKSRIGNNSGNSRNGYSEKKVITDNQELQVKIPRDRESSFEPVAVPKYQKRVPIFNDQIISLYSGGMSCREIQRHLERVYGVEVSPELISRITDSVMEEVRQWRARMVDKAYPIIYLDALRVKSKQDGKSVNKAVYVALGVNFEGKKEVLGLWIGENEGAKYWMGILNELKTRGLEDILIVCSDGLKGFPEAIKAVYPNTKTQLCIVHMVRNSTRFVSYKDLKEVCADLKKVYTSASEEEGLESLEDFGEKWNGKYPMIYKSWKDNWENLNEFFGYSPDIRRAIYTTNAVESLNYQLRRIIKNRQIFPNDDAIIKIMYLALKNASQRWTMPVKNWGLAPNQFAILFGEDRIIYS